MKYSLDPLGEIASKLKSPFRSIRRAMLKSRELRISSRVCPWGNEFRGLMRASVLPSAESPAGDPSRATAGTEIATHSLGSERALGAELAHGGRVTLGVCDVVRSVRPGHAVIGSDHPGHR